MKNKTIIGCGLDCPFHADYTGECNLTGRSTDNETDPPRKWTPDWCPLKNGPITVQLSEDATRQDTQELS